MPKKSEYALALLYAYFEIEMWKSLKSFPNYEVSNLGRIRRKWKSIGYRIIKGRKSSEYLTISIGNKTCLSIHRLVALTFIPNMDKKMSVDHIISREKCNNKLTNLRWSTPYEQNKNRDTSRFGIKNCLGVKCLHKNTGEILNTFNSLKEALNWLGKDDRCGSHITNVCRKNPKFKSAYGYKWEYDQELYLENEEWKDIPNMNGEYQISSYGRLYHKTNNIIRKNSMSKDGYIRVNICKYKCRELLHRLVARVFITNPNPEVKTQVNHKNMDRSNCHVSNLEWVSCSENVKHSYENRNNSVKITLQQSLSPNDVQGESKDESVEHGLNWLENGDVLHERAIPRVSKNESRDENIEEKEEELSQHIRLGFGLDHAVDDLHFT